MEVNEKAPSTSPPLSLTSQRTSVTTMMGDTIVNSNIVKVSSSSSERGEGRTTSSSSSSSMNTSDNQIHRSPYGKNYNDSRHYHNEMKVEHEVRVILVCFVLVQCDSQHVVFQCCLFVSLSALAVAVPAATST